jgi:hypothetical protein
VEEAKEDISRSSIGTVLTIKRRWAVGWVRMCASWLPNEMLLIPEDRTVPGGERWNCLNWHFGSQLLLILEPEVLLIPQVSRTPKCNTQLRSVSTRIFQLFYFQYCYWPNALFSVIAKQLLTEVANDSNPVLHALELFEPFSGNYIYHKL